MKLKIGEILESRRVNLAHIPMGEGRYEPVSELEEETLKQFADIQLELSPGDLPLEIYYMGGNTRTLAIYPSSGRMIRPIEEITVEKSGYQITIFPYSHK